MSNFFKSSFGDISFFMVLTKAAFIWSKWVLLWKKNSMLIYFIIMQFIPMIAKLNFQHYIMSV